MDSEIKETNGKVIFKITGSEIKSTNGATLYKFTGNEIKQTNGKADVSDPAIFTGRTE